MNGNAFFEEQTEQSRVKAEIVRKYFSAWAKVMIRTVGARGGKIAYIDLFAGPGRYKDGSLSTPILILQQAIQDDDLRQMLVTLFNDVNAEHARSLEQAIAAIPGIDRLQHKPQVSNDEVGENIVRRLEKIRLVPTLCFVDPWGYKGLSLGLINSVLKDWGCDCIIFFNYNRINTGLNNPAVRQHMDALFGAQRAEELRLRVERMSPGRRELAITEAIADALKETGGRYVLPFRFRSADGARTSHHLIFVTKHVLGYEIMKGIMARESSTREQGVPSFEYSTAGPDQPLLFQLCRPLDDLAGMLQNEFAGRTLTMSEVYEQHHIDRPYIKPNYKDVLALLESQGKIAAYPPAEERLKRKGKVTFADGVQVTFPAKGG